MTAIAPTRAANASRSVVRSSIWLALCVVEMLAISLAHELPAVWLNPFFYFRMFGLWGLASVVAFALLAWSDRAQIFATLQADQEKHDWRRPLAANLALFAVLLSATAILANQTSIGQPPSSLALVAYDVLLALTIAFLFCIDVPYRTFGRILKAHRFNAALAIVAGAFVRGISFFAQDGWNSLAGITLTLVRQILNLYEPHVIVDTAERTVEVGQFQVLLTPNCSGYEGIALIVSFLAIYLWAFRDRLRFPAAFVLFPIGIIGIWLLNALRIAMLVTLGAHVSPDAAMHGFHSQAGWIAFLGVTLAMIAVTNTSRLFATGSKSAASDARPTARSANSAINALLAPFVALMFGTIVMSAAAPADRPFYVVKVAAVAFALWHFRRFYRTFDWSVSWEAVAAGALVGVAWIATNPFDANHAALAQWAGFDDTRIATAWLLLRVVGSAVLVPAAEELAFRAFLYRRLISSNFESVPYRTLSVMALVANSLVFGFMHERWIAAALSGVVFTLVMVRAQRPSAAFYAHAAANLAICIWAIAMQEWSLL